MSKSPSPTYGQLFEVDHDAALREKFASSQGIVVLQPEINDAMQLVAIKIAISAAKGKLPVDAAV